MKKIILSILFLVPTVVMAQKKIFHIKGKLNIKDVEAVVKLVCNSPIIREEAKVNNGFFELKGKIDEPVKASLTLEIIREGKTKKEVFLLYLSPETIILESPTDSLVHSKIVNSKINQEFQKLQVVLKPIETAEIIMLENKLRHTASDKKSDTVTSNIEKKLDEIRSKKKAIYLNFLQEHPNSFLSLDALNKYTGRKPDYELAASLFNKFSAMVKSTPTGKRYAAEMKTLRLTSIGAKAPNFTQFDLDGKPVKLSDYKGKYVLVDFWASWCEPCRKENPNLLKAYHTFHPKGLEILGVSVDAVQFKESWLKAIEEDRLPWKQVCDLRAGNEAVRVYSIKSIPQNVLVSPEGKIVAKNLKGEELHQRLAEIFDEKS